MKRMFAVALAATAVGQTIEAQPSPPSVRWGGYLDAYYAYDLGRPRTLDRSFTTQPARSDEFNVNLAFIEATLAGDGIRGRLALQAGTSVQSNYAGEPTRGDVSGPSLARHIQEAYVGVRVAPSVWIDAGIFWSNVGVESWVPTDNVSLTRSLTADFSPYYSSGVRAIWQASPRISLRMDLVNGWQNISETNTDKAIGTRLDLQLTEALTASQYLFVGNEVGRARLFGGVGLAGALSPLTTVAANVDVGREAGTAGGSPDTWAGGALQVRRQLSERSGVTARGEWYRDRGQVIIATALGQPGFRATGASVGFDRALRPGVSWRSEARLLTSGDAVFPDRDAGSGFGKRNVVLTTLLAYRF